MSYSGVTSGLAARRAIEVPRPSLPRKSGYRARLKELELKVANLQRDYADLHGALIEAAQVHRRLCAPRLVRSGSFEIASETFAVRHVPGDFFILNETDKGILFALSDIGGKGLAAGMWITYLVGTLEMHRSESAAPEQIMAGVNQDLCRLATVAPLASLFLGNLDPHSGRLEYCSAGHPPALLLHADGKLESLSDGGPLLGALPTADFERGRVNLRPGDVLLICSDGILESLDNEEQEFGYERLQQHLRSAPNGSAEGVLFSVLGVVQDFAATRPIVDDMSLVVLRHRSIEV